MLMTAAPVSFANRQYTIDTFPENPARESHELARLTLAGDRFILDGDIYGARFASSAGHFGLDQGQLSCQPDDGSAALQLAVGERGPEDFWPGRDIALSGLPAWEGKKVTLHRVPDVDRFSGELSPKEQGMVGHHHFASERLGAFDLTLRPDRSGTLDGELAGRRIAWQGRWMSAFPMSYFQVADSANFVSWHNNRDCGGHGNHHHGEPPAVETLSNMPVDVIACTQGADAPLRRVYAMVMNPTSPDKAEA